MIRLRKKKSKKKSMLSGRTSLTAGTSLFLLLPLLLLASCAKPPWTAIIDEEQKSAVEQTFLEFSASQDRCRQSWDAEVDISWKSAVRNYAFSAYYQVLGPSYLKLIVSNPLGQPLKAIATNGTTYQAVDAVARSMVTGSLHSWAISHDLPLNLVNGSWLDWLEGRSSATIEQIGEIRYDSQERGVWLSIVGAESNEIEEYILLDRETKRIVERILVADRQGSFATLEYQRWEEIDQCFYPVLLAISGLPLGGQAELRFSEIRQSDFVPADFNLDFPREFSRTWLP